MEARPAMAPVAMPTMLGLPNLTASMTSQTSAAVAAEMCVTVIAMPASAPAFSALPALKPYQPTQSMQAPTMVIQGACGGLTSLGEAGPRSDQNGEDQRRDAGGKMHHQSAGEIEHATRGEEAAAPDPVRHRHVDQQQPERREEEHGTEAHALDEGADDQRRRDDGESHLEHEEDGLGDVRPGIDGIAADAREQRLVEIAEPRHGAAEGETVGDEPAKAAIRDRRWQNTASAPTADSRRGPVLRRRAPSPARS